MNAPVTNGSSASVVFLLFLLLVGFFVVLIPVLIGRYVYKDAKSRNMDAVLWTLVAILVPSFIGLIIYLVIRSNNPNINCSSCQKPVAAEYLLCPYCGLHLKGACPACKTPIDGDWKLCPKCGANLPAQTKTDIAAYPKKDRKLGGILALTIGVPIVILMIAIAGLGLFMFSSDSAMSGGGPVTRWEDGKVYSPVSEWVEECDKQGKGVYVLEIKGEKAEEFYKFTNPHGGMPLDKESYVAIIYLNEYKGTHGETGFSGGGSEMYIGTKTLIVDYQTTSAAEEKQETDYVLDYTISSGSKNTVEKFIVKIDGEEVAYSLSELK